MAIATCLPVAPRIPPRPAAQKFRSGHAA